MIAVIDYGVGNLFSLCASLKKIGADAIVTRDLEVIKKADKIILPGVGAFGDAMDKLLETGLVPHLLALAAEGKPFMGICLGMQLLFERSFEFGEKQGLGLIKGSVCDLSADIPQSLKVPHMGWNALDIRNP
ncbi:MAG: imidazole glycerol phosphate synthase subunit HisH, partial [Clostridia bacterium]|nr:imidazole glycerol phosphate synthase subunit HisH [Clostridia bacterium]